MRSIELQIFRGRKAMIAVSHQGQRHITINQPGQFERMLPWHIGVFHALHDTRRTMRPDGRAHDEMPAPIFDQRARDRIWVGVISRGAQPFALFHNSRAAHPPATAPKEVPR